MTLDCIAELKGLALVEEDLQAGNEGEIVRQKLNSEASDGGSAPPLFSIFYTFVKIGSVTFGGGIAMLPLLQVELVEKRKWLDHQGYADCLMVAQSTPGPIVVNLSLVAGFRVLGLKGGLCALLGVILPSFLLLLAVAMFLWPYRENPLAHAAFQGIGPAVAALIAAAAVKLGKNILSGYRSLLLLIFFLGGLLVFNIHPLYVIIFGGLAGFFLPPAKDKREE